jgi:hypothetical protein
MTSQVQKTSPDATRGNDGDKAADARVGGESRDFLLVKCRNRLDRSVGLVGQELQRTVLHPLECAVHARSMRGAANARDRVLPPVISYIAAARPGQDPRPVTDPISRCQCVAMRDSGERIRAAVLQVCSLMDRCELYDTRPQP